MIVIINKDILLDHGMSYAIASVGIAIKDL